MPNGPDRVADAAATAMLAEYSEQLLWYSRRCAALAREKAAAETKARQLEAELAELKKQDKQ